MNNMLKLVSLLTCLCLLLGSVALADTYTATANGYGGQMTIEVVIENGVITDVVLGENHETNVVMDRAFPVIRERILTANTADVDSVSAATFSSYAVKTAVADAMKQAGLEAPAVSMQNAEKPATERAAETCDIVIVGGGPAGLAAAIGAKQTNANANIIIVEKLDILSGNGKFDMNFFDMINTKAQHAANTERYITNQIENFKEDKANAGETAERIAVWAEEENNIDAWLREMGVELNYNYGGTNHMAEADRYAGEAIQDGLENAVFGYGVDVRTGTKGVDLVMEDGVCKGVIVTNNQNETYTINAKNTIIATGGWCFNKELLAKYAPGYEVFNTSNQMGATGDFVPVFEKLGFKLENMGNIRVFPYILAVRRDLTGGSAGFLLFNKNGERFIDETAGNLGLGTTLLEQSPAYYIYDSTNYNANYRLRKHTAAGYHVKADTLDELSEKLGMNAENLKAGIETYNKAVAGECDDPFRAKPGPRAFDAEGPYYAAHVESAVHMTKGGVSCNEFAQVLYADDTVVENLYACGEVTWQSGGYSQSVVFGRVAGEQAAKAMAE